MSTGLHMPFMLTAGSLAISGGRSGMLIRPQHIDRLQVVRAPSLCQLPRSGQPQPPVLKIDHGVMYCPVRSFGQLAKSSIGQQPAISRRPRKLPLIALQESLGGRDALAKRCAAAALNASNPALIVAGELIRLFQDAGLITAKSDHCQLPALLMNLPRELQDKSLGQRQLALPQHGCRAIEQQAAEPIRRWPAELITQMFC